MFKVELDGTLWDVTFKHEIEVGLHVNQNPHVVNETIGTTQCMVTSADGKENFYFARAFCSAKEEKFDRNKGRKTALTKAIGHFRPGERFHFWAAYRDVQGAW